MPGDFFFQALIYLTAAVVSVPIAKRAGVGSVLGYLIAGIAIGPFVFGFIGDETEEVMHFAEFGVVMMLFLIGLELEPARVWRMRAPIIGLGGLQVAVTTLAIGGIGLALGCTWQAAIAVGLTLALSSTAIVLQTLKEKGLSSTAGGRSAFAVLLLQDIAVIPILAIFPLLGAAGVDDGSHGHTWVADLPGWGKTCAVLGAIVAIVVAGRFLVEPLFRLIASTGLREVFTATALLLVIATATLMTMVGVSPALGTFLAGVVLARSGYRHQLESDIEPFKGLLLGLFFIAVGASIDFELIASAPGTIFGLMGALIAVKFVILFVLGRVFRLGLDQNILFAVCLAQGGEFAFVLLALADRSGILGTSTSAMLLVVVALTMALAPILLLINEKLIQPHVGTRERGDRDPDAIDEANPVIIAGFGSFGNAAGRLLIANGIQTTVLDNDSDRVDLLRKLGLRVYYGDATRESLLHAAGAEHARLLILALGQEQNRSLLATVRKHYPHLQVLVRAHDRRDAYELIEAGVEHVYRGQFHSSVRLGIDALRMLGFRGHQAHRAAQTFIRHDEASLRELARMRHDQREYINAARQRIRDLEVLLRGNLRERDRSEDAGWDATTLRTEFKLNIPIERGGKLAPRPDEADDGDDNGDDPQSDSPPRGSERST